MNDVKEDVTDLDKKEEGNALLRLLNTVVKLLLYPLFFIFLMIYPYIYVTFTSFKKLLKSYRNNVLTI